MGPHEVLLLVNSNSLRSKQVANYYVRLRQIPPRNIVYLSLPNSVLDATAEITPDDFTRFIWNPVNEAVKKRQIGDHILAWIYSVDFPIRVSTVPAMSLQGMTFVRNIIPEKNIIEKGLYGSALFAGPDKAGGLQAPAHSLEGFKGHLGENMPLPSMMLGWCGARGMEEESVLEWLRRAATSDLSSPGGTVFFFTTDDIRSKCREWQYAAVQKELESLHVASLTTSVFPSRKNGVLGLLCGTPWIHPSDMPSFLPGSMADTLTSYAGVMESPDHTKLTDWLRAGAAGSAGAVTEPFAIWTKFPSARFYVHYASGCTMIESFFQSIRCPLQLAIVGEPLACPWSRRPSIVLVQTDDGSIPDKAVFHVQLFPANPTPAPDYLYLVDDQVRARAPVENMELSTAGLSDGYHEVRVVAYLQGAVRQQAFATAGFTVNRKGRVVKFDNLADKTRVDLFHPLRLRVSASDKPAKLGAVCGENILAEVKAEESTEFEIDPTVLGLGPNRLQAVAVYKDGETVCGAPVAIEGARLNQPPSIQAIHVQTNAQNQIVLVPDVSDPENDPIRVDWFLLVADARDGTGPSASPFELSGGDLKGESGTYILTPSTNFMDTAVLSRNVPIGVAELTVRVSVTADSSNLRGLKAGLVFNYRDRRNYNFAGWRGDDSAWVVSSCREGIIYPKETRGASFQPGREYLLSLRRFGDNGVEFSVDGNVLVKSTDGDFGGGRFGLSAGGNTTRFRNLAISPPSDFVRVEGNHVVISPLKVNEMTLSVRASDGHALAAQSIRLP